MPRRRTRIPALWPHAVALGFVAPQVMASRLKTLHETQARSPAEWQSQWLALWAEKGAAVAESWLALATGPWGRSPAATVDATLRPFTRRVKANGSRLGKAQTQSKTQGKRAPKRRI